MAAPRLPPRGHDPPEAEDWARDLTDRFRQTLSSKRMNELSNQSSHSRSSSPACQLFEPSTRHPPHIAPPSAPPQTPMSDGQPIPYPSMPLHPPPGPPPPSRHRIRNLPLEPIPPTDARSIRFRNLLHTLSEMPVKWENPGLLDEALRVIPLERIYNEAEEESQIYQAEAASLGDISKAKWGYQDCLVRALQKWFKQSFFTWINNPPCPVCHSPTVARGRAAPLPEEVAGGASQVEAYQCPYTECGAYERFPRYSDAFVLLRTRRGRLGEWANCFAMLCRAMNQRVRWIWCAEDLVWIEVYSIHRKRWIHVDVVEGYWDQPRVYTEAWNHKISYCIAFSADGATDVTRRYVRNPAAYGLARKRAPEAVLLHILDEIRSVRRKDRSKEEKRQLYKEDMRESDELQRYIILTMAAEVAKMPISGVLQPDGTRVPTPDEQKAAEARQQVDEEWMRQIQNANPNFNPHHPR